MLNKVIRIREDQQKWLDDHPEINLSGLCRKAMDAEIRKNSSSSQKGLTNHSEAATVAE